MSQPRRKSVAPMSPEEINTILRLRRRWHVSMQASRHFMGDTIGVTWSTLAGGLAIWLCVGRLAVGITMYRDSNPQFPEK